MKYSSVLDFDFLNGEGVRVSLWVSGCPHACPNCHNSDLWDSENGKEFTEGSMSGLLELLERDYPKDLSILGGEPLAPYNVQEVTRICKRVKDDYPDKSIWIWTGYNYDEVKNLELMEYIDVLVDGKYVEELKDPDLVWCGSSNQRIIDIKALRAL